MALRTSPRPKTQVIVVPVDQREKPFEDVSAYWVFGPGTKHKWPSGDFVDRFESSTPGLCESAWFFEDLITRPDVAIHYGPDMQVDVGL